MPANCARMEDQGQHCCRGSASPCLGRRNARAASTSALRAISSVNPQVPVEITSVSSKAVTAAAADRTAKVTAALQTGVTAPLPPSWLRYLSVPLGKQRKGEWLWPYESAVAQAEVLIMPMQCKAGATP